VAVRSLVVLLGAALLATGRLAFAMGPQAAPNPATPAAAPTATGTQSVSPPEKPAPAEKADPPLPASPPPPEPRRAVFTNSIRPPPLHVEYAQYGVAIHAIANLSSGATCGANVMAPGSAHPPCILGSGGGLLIRGGYRSPGPWYFGGAYSFAKMDSSNLYRLGIFQQLSAEMRYLPDTGYRATPYATWGLGGVWYGNEWGVETGGAMIFAGGGLEFQVSRIAVVGLGLVYKPTLIAGWTDTAGITRPMGLAHFFNFEVQLEVRSELGRR
jgi:hypothetical protein